MIRNRNLWQLAAAILVTFTAASTSFAQQITVTHQQGEETVNINPEVVLSYGYASIDTLATHGVEVDGAPLLTNAAPPSCLQDSPINIDSL